MDDHIGDLHSAIVDRELEIIQELVEEVLKHDEVIALICDICAELDCLLSFSEASRLFNFKRPEMTEGNYIKITQGRLAFSSQEEFLHAISSRLGTLFMNKWSTHLCQTTRIC